MSCRIHRRRLLQSAAAWAGCLTLPPSLEAVGREKGHGDSPVAAPSHPVAIGRCSSYAKQRLATALRTTLDAIGGIQKLVAGKTVTIKLNLTGGPRWKLGGLPAYRTYHVHPNFVAATCAALHDAGARRIVLVESCYEQRPLDEIMSDGGWDIAQINQAGGGKVQWEDTRHRGPWKQYSRFKVPWGGYVYPAFDLNQRYEKTDVFISLAKLKDHANAGVTMSVKNLFGIAPTSLYGDNYNGARHPTENEVSKSARGDTFHKGIRQPPSGVPQEVDADSPRLWKHRVPRITADLFALRPPDLCLVDGIETNRGGEGPWIKGTQPLAPHVLFAGRNGVCTDAVCTAVMGYDATADHGQFPFMGDNHLKLLAEKGIGSHRVDDIEVRGLAIAEARFPFNPEHRVVGQPIFE